MKRSEGIFGGLVCLLLATVLVLGLLFPAAAAAESEETSDQPVIALTEDAGIQAQADVDCIAGNSYSLSGTIRTYDGTSKITYSSSDTSIASITSQSTSSTVLGSYGIFSYTLNFTTYKSGTVTIQGVSNNGSVKMSRTITVKAPEATSVSLSASSYEVTVGSTVQASASVSPSLADQTVTWLVQDENIASVDKTGKITGVKAGTTKITATTGNGLKKSATLRVYDQVTSIALSQSQLSLVKGNSGTLTATVLPGTAIQTVTWTSSNTDVATVSSGKVTAAAAGTATITAKSSNGKTATCKVTVTLPDATSVSLSQSSVTIAKGVSATITATVKPSDASQSVTWSTSNSKIATVSGGKITGVGVGSATVTAKTANGKTATCKVTVTYADATSVSLNRSTLTLTKGDSSTLTATVKPSDASQSVTWSTSNSKIATVSSGKSHRDYSRNRDHHGQNG